MKNIIWQSRSAIVSDSVNQGSVSPDANGGNAYDILSVLALKSAYEVSVSEETIMRPGESVFSYWRRIRHFNPQADVIIREPYPVVFGRRKADVPYVAMIHHIDDDLRYSSLRHRVYFSSLLRKLKKTDLVITVSRYWKDYLEEAGCKRVKIIYNSFDPAEYKASQESISNFKVKNNIPPDKTLIYAGNAEREKGIYQVYEALKNSDCHLLMSGSQNKAADLPVQYLRLDRSAYITMLHACDLVITMSQMTEGWNRIAHESLLCGTPVIGSGAGGMKELLTGAGQLIITDGTDLLSGVRDVIKHRDQYVLKGKLFAEQFDMVYFKNEWIETIRQVLK